MRTYFALVVVGSTACAAAGGDGAGGAGGTGADDGSTGSGSVTTVSTTGTTGATGGGSDCILDTPCASDIQCTSLAGTACNDELPTPKCQRLSCGAEVPCDGRDEFCSPDRLCRIVDHASGLACLPQAITTQECETSCNTAPVDSDSGCSIDPHTLCAKLCARPDLCIDAGGFKHVRRVTSCYLPEPGEGYARFDLWCKGDTNDLYDVSL